MLSYRHGFHAGNFADVFKHAVLTLLLEALRRKEKPFAYLETHAGAGRYDLSGAFALKNAEFRSGIGRLWARTDVPSELSHYLGAVRTSNRGDDLRLYPGSPLIARTLLRPQDRMVLCELHNSEIVRLQELFAHDRQVTVYHRDGYPMLKALLPPPERRGLVFCDPSFELKGEREKTVEALATAWKRWPTGMFALWHPIQERAVTERLYRCFRNTGMPKMLLAELYVLPEAVGKQMTGSGMILVNPPWQLDDQLQSTLPWLKKVLAVEGQGSWRVEWLTGPA